MNWRRIFRRNRRDAELTSEIETHIAEETAENIDRGIPAEEARRQAYLKFGNPQLLRERHLAAEQLRPRRWPLARSEICRPYSAALESFSLWLSS